MSSDAGPINPTYFDRAYRDYEAQNPLKKLDHYLDIIESKVGRHPKSLLDIGCGMGSFLERAADRFPESALAGIDQEISGVEKTSARVPRAKVSVGLANSLPFPDESFEVITAWDVLEHVPHVDEAVSEIKRCLQPDGLAAIVVPVYDGVTGPLVRALDKDRTHVHKSSKGFWRDLIAGSFDDMDWHGIHRLLITRNLYLHRPTKRLRNATAAILLTARRR